MYARAIGAQLCLRGSDLDAIAAIGETYIPEIIIWLTAEAHGSGGTPNAGERKIDHDTEDTRYQQR
jgi:hypothetical protein